MRSAWRSCGTCPVRVIAYRLKGSDETHVLLTTLCDPVATPAAEQAALYHECWEIETAHDEVKTHILGSRRRASMALKQQYWG